MSVPGLRDSAAVHIAFFLFSVVLRYVKELLMPFVARTR